MLMVFVRVSMHNVEFYVSLLVKHTRNLIQMFLSTKSCAGYSTFLLPATKKMLTQKLRYEALTRRPLGRGYLNFLANSSLVHSLVEYRLIFLAAFLAFRETELDVNPSQWQVLLLKILRCPKT